MNIEKIMQFATEGLKAVKSMPLAGKVAVGTLFGVGGLAGVLIGDSFEKGAGVKEEVKEETDTTKDGLPAKIQGEDGFVFNMPETGKNNITGVKVEEAYPNGQPKYITCTGEGNKTITISLKEDGTLSWYSEHNFSKSYGYSDTEKTYDSKGELASMTRQQNHHYFHETYDKNGTVSERYTYNEMKDKSYNQYEKDGKLVSKEEYTTGNNNHLLKKFEYNDDGTLKHTIIPQYNEDGELVRRDTIQNE